MSFEDAMAAASTAAMTDIQAPAAPAPAEVAPAAAPEPVAPAEPAPNAAAPAEAPPAPDTAQPAAGDPPSPADPVDTTGGQKWTFTRKGQQVEVADPTQALELIRKGYDYTEKTMELATQRKAFEEQMTAARQWMQNPQNLRQVLAHLEAQQPPQAPQPQTSAPAADDLATHEDLQRYQQQLAAQLQATQQQTAQMIQSAQLRAETDRYTQEYKAEVNKTLSTLYDSYPLLKEVEKVEKLILDDVSEQIRLQVQENPDNVVSIDEVKVLLAQNAKRRHDRLDAKLKDFRKMEVVRQAKLTTQGAEPPGGAPPAPPPPKAYKLGDPALTADVIKELQQAFDSKR